MSNKMTKCKTCGAEVAKSAKTCPACGAKRKKMGCLPSVLVVILVLALIGMIGGESEPTGPQKVGDASTPTQQETPKQEEPKQEVPKQEEPKPAAPKQEEPAKKTKFGVGEVVELNDVRVTLLGVTESKGKDFFTPTDGNVFLVCEFEIENNSDREVNVSSLLSFEAYVDDYACNLSMSAIAMMDNKTQLDGTIAGGKKMRGIVGYEAAADWKEIEIKFTPNVWSGKDITFVANK